ncbi:DNA ligase D [Cytobacillus gottheilii]|uniref:DNA ligase D n=1 Tax=Cytobacillus gottheilii TaxID=859144 RepID=UPI0009BB4C58|nr:DNA ligase D [Cytobacillus gottheilii]
MKPMLPTLTFENISGDEWNHEVKYDGFRAILEWTHDGIKIKSRNDKPLQDLFPEISHFLLENEQTFLPYIPFTLDGELVSLENSFKADFSAIQIRGRMRSEGKIKEKAENRPCRLLIFDILSLKGETQVNKTYLERKAILTDFFQLCHLPLQPDERSKKLLQMIPFEKKFSAIWEQVVLSDGEGIVSKRSNQRYDAGKRSSGWLKYKNWKYVNCFIIKYEKSNGYFYSGVYDLHGQIIDIGQFLFGLKPDEKNALMQTIKNNKTDEDQNFIYVEPAICTEIKYLEMYDNQMREPHFHRFRFDLQPAQCTYQDFVQQQKNLTADINITHPDKPLWINPAIKKVDYIHFLQEISPYLLPFLQNRTLTVIRYPHGMLGEPFYQKNVPEYAPSFIETKKHEDIEYIVCNHLQSLLWLGNQLAFEFHIPFQTIHSTGPSEIVFDLDPPSVEGFPLAIKAALLIKEVLDGLSLTGFIKTSGSKGLQVYIPLPDNQYTFDDTRLFTSFIAHYLITKDPDSFTIERLKKNRGNRLYVDYIQHAEGKTIIAPYSPRGKEKATVAAPLYWKEVNHTLKIEDFTIKNMIPRLKENGDPFSAYFETKETQPFAPVRSFLKQEEKKIPKA